MEFHLSSYESHQHVKHDSKLTSTWKSKNTVDYWRHLRMYRQVDPLINAYPNSHWLTVGDGRYGTDANYLNERGIHALATDINGTCLKQAKDEGFITDYAVENAEKLSFADNQFDFVLCKESYHHFPRPMIALYEMLRVAKNAVVLIEPNDQSTFEPYYTSLQSSAFWLMFALKQVLKRKIGKETAQFPNRYEPMGNYVFSISRRELEKVALGLNLDAIATKGLNDFYLEGVEFEDIDKNGPLLLRVKENIQQLDNVSMKRPDTYGLLAAIIFKKLPSQECIDSLKEQQFNFKVLSKNPYITPS